MIHKRGNYSFKQPPFQEGDTITGGNYQQLIPNTEICADIENLTISGGNWINCKKKPTWIITGGNWAKISRCSNLHPEWIQFGLDECSTTCSHLIDTDEIWIDGELVDTIYHYEDTII